MGSTCCGNNNVQQTQLPQQQEGTENYQEFKKLTQVEIQFLNSYPKMKTTLLKKIIRDLPANWIIDRNSTAQVKGQGTYIGRKNPKNRNGYGAMIYQLGFYYVGCWQENCRYGMGYMIDKNGNYYKGEWVKDEPHGYGEYYDYENDYKWFYKGKWKNSKKQGLGLEQYPDGTQFRGYYRDGLRKGYGEYIFTESCYFKGNLTNDIVNGLGEQKGQDYLYKGPWKDNEMHGAGTVEYWDESGKVVDKYIGEYVKGIKHGYGQYKWKNGMTYKGQWENGEIINKGLLQKGA